MLVITTKDRVDEIVDKLLIPYCEYKLDGIGLYDTEIPDIQTIKKVPVISGKKKLVSYIQQNVIDEIFIDLETSKREVEYLVSLFVNMGLTVHLNLDHFTSFTLHKKINNVGGCVVLTSCMKFASPSQLLFKRLMDISGALIGLIFAGIAFVIFGPVIYYQSPGPIFFSQDRVGRNGRVFKIYKFRSMYMDAEEQKKELMEQNKMRGFMFKMDDDPRIIPIGHFIRKTSIDELPQFWNILKGEMSLVGTRPPTIDEYKQYEVQHRKRLAMKPGLTGMWQVSGRSDIVDFEEIVALDADYIEKWTLNMDIKILWKTLRIVLLGEGAV